MASEVKTNKVSPATGTDVTLGDASDTFTVPSGSAIVIASGGDINVESSGEIDIASGATLDVNGTIDLTGATKTGFPAGGNTHSSQWRLTASFTNSLDPIKLNWGAVITSAPETNTASPTSSTALGAPMEVNTTTGYWTFPVTGMWFVEFVSTYNATTYNAAPAGGVINYTTDDGSSVDKISPENGQVDGRYGHSYNSVLLKIENTSEDKVSFSTYSAVTTDFIGSATMQWTWATFTKLGDA